MALAAAVYLSVMGKVGLRKVAELCLQKSNYLKKNLGKKVVFTAPTFKEFVVKTDKKIGLDLNNGLRLLCVTELAGKKQLDALFKGLT